MTVDTSYDSTPYELYVALDCDIDPRINNERSVSTCVSTGVLALADTLDPAVDPVVSLSAVVSDAGGSVAIGGEGVGWDKCSDGRLSSLVSGLVVYGLERRPATVTYTVNGQEVTEDVSTDYTADIYYEADMNRLQARNLVFDFCSEEDRALSWDY